MVEAKAKPDAFAGKGIGDVADYEESIISRLDRKPVIIGHSFGGLLTEILAGRGLAHASVAISPAPFRGMLPLPISEAKVDTKNPMRGPMLIISADSDHTAPWAIANASYKLEKRNGDVPEIVKMRGRGHSLTIDAGWQEVAQTALDFVRRFT